MILYKYIILNLLNFLKDKPIINTIKTIIAVKLDELSSLHLTYSYWEEWKEWMQGITEIDTGLTMPALRFFTKFKGSRISPFHFSNLLIGTKVQVFYEIRIFDENGTTDRSTIESTEFEITDIIISSDIINKPGRDDFYRFNINVKANVGTDIPSNESDKIGDLLSNGYAEFYIRCIVNKNTRIVRWVLSDFLINDYINLVYIESVIITTPFER